MWERYSGRCVPPTARNTGLCSGKRAESVQPISESVVLGLRPAAGVVKKMLVLKDEHGEEA